MAYEPADIEKKSLEAHVELCSERYTALELRLDSLDDKITGLGKKVDEIHSDISAMSEKRNDQLIKWGVSLISLFAGSTVWLLIHYVIK